MSPLTADQQATVTELQNELRDLKLQEDEQWREYLKTGTEECFNACLALQGEIEMKGLIAYMPKAGEGKISKIRSLITKVKQSGGEDCEDCGLPSIVESRLKVLADINDWRENYGLPALTRLPKGVIGDPADCVIARAYTDALGSLVGQELRDSDDIEFTLASMGSMNIAGDGLHATVWDTNGYDHRVDFPDNANAEGMFISAFDSLHFADLLTDNDLVMRVVDIASGEQSDENGNPVTDAAEFGHALEEVFERGLVERVVTPPSPWLEDLLAGRHYGRALTFSDGTFTLTINNMGEEPAHTHYEVGTAGPIRLVKTLA